MAADDSTGERKGFHYEGGVPVFDIHRIDELERKETEAREREREYTRQQLNLNRWMVRFTCLLVICSSITGGIGAYQAHVADKSANAAKEAADTAENSFKLTKRHTEDTDEAIAQMRGELQAGTNIEVITVSNVGRVSAHGFFAHIEISRSTLPSNRRENLLATTDMSQDELRINAPFSKEIVLPTVGQNDWDRLNRFEEAIVVSATMQYENGFDEIRRPIYCQDFLVQRAHPGDKPQTPSNVLVDCDRLPTYFEHERLIQQTKH